MINAEGAALITAQERIMLKAYICPAGKPTIGRGHTDGVTFEDVKNGRMLTVSDEQELFQKDMEQWERDVKACLTRTPNENQLAAMVSLAFNIGMGAFKNSSVLKYFNKGDDTATARAFALWNKITDPKTKQKIVSNGLVARRAAEIALYLKPIASHNEPIPAMPQEVVPPVTMAASAINKSAVITGAGASVALVTDVVNKVREFKSGWESLGHWAIPILLVVVIGAAGWTLYTRLKMRREGSA